MTGKHLGERVHDLLDNRLSRDETAEAMAHLADCDECTERWQELRAAREALNSSEAGIDMRFAQQLLDKDRMSEIARAESRHHARVARGRDRRPLLAAGAAASVLGVGVAAAYYAGAPDDLTLEFASASAGNGQAVSFVGPQDMRSGDQLRSWLHPDWDASGLVPVEASVKQRPGGDSVLIASVLHGLEPILVIEQHGRLSAPLVAELPRADVEGIDAYVVDSSPAQLVWQTGDVVISVACECSQATLETVAGHFPTTDGPGFVDRVATGFGEFADALAGG